MDVGLTYDLRDENPPYPHAPSDYFAEFDSGETIGYLETAIENAGHRVCRIGSVEELLRFIADGKSVDIVFNIAEGMRGRAREAQVPAVLEAFQIPYVFSDPLTMALCLDKAMTKRLLQWAGLPTPDFCTISDVSELDQRAVELPGFPLFVKPVHEGTSKGINAGAIVTSAEALSGRVAWLLETYRQPVLVESHLTGPEYTVGILGNGAGVKVVGVLEITVVNSQNGVYGFLQKEECESRVVYTPVGSVSLRAELAALALQAYRVTECCDAGRVDIRLDASGNLHLLEVNPLPGLHPTHSDLPMMAPQAGMSYDGLIGEILQHAIVRWGM